MSVSQIREYAEMQRNRARAYSLMKAGDKQANLKRAIACYEKALQVYTREQYPEEWAELHYDIGNTYQNLPTSASEKSTNLQEAIAHYEKALQEHILHDERWAIIYFRLGEAYYHLTTGMRQTNLTRAIAAYQRSLEVYTRRDFPAQWAMAHLCIGEALRNLPEDDLQADKQTAFIYYQDALQVYTRQSFPKQWAMTQRSMGDLYFSIRYEEPPPSSKDNFSVNRFSDPNMIGRPQPDLLPNLRDAILCYQGALQVYTRENYPAEWAATLYSLGNSCRSIRGDGQRASLEQAIDCYRQVLQVYTLESAPLEWARTQWDLGDAYISVAKDKGSPARKLAITCYEQAIKIYTRVDFPHEWATLQKNLQSARDEQTNAWIEDVLFSRREYKSATRDYQEVLRHWGIRLLDNADTDIQRIGQRLGFMPLSWRRVVMMDKSRDGLMWRIPDPAVAAASSLMRVQAIIVAENERVMVLRDGMLGEQTVLPPGLYDIRRTTELRGQIDVIWFTTREFQLRWGVGDIITKDRVTVGASGYYNAKIVDPEMFLRNVVGNEQVYKEMQLLNFAKPFVSAAIRDIMARKTVMAFQFAQPEFQLACLEALMPRFESWGLEFCGLTIEAQNIPEEFAAAAQLQTIVRMEKEALIEGATADVTLAELEAQKAQYAALDEANRLRALGNIKAEIMQNQLNAGIDPLELQKIEAIKLLAENPSEGTLVDNRPQIANQLLPQPPLMPPTGPVIVTDDPLVSSTSHLNPPASLPENSSSETPSSTGETITREKIEEMLNKLDERFANGEISEQVYLTLQAKWQKHLEKLP